MRTEKSRLQRRLTDLPDQMRQMRHFSVREQVLQLNRTLWGHYGCRQRRLFRAGSVTDPRAATRLISHPQRSLLQNDKDTYQALPQPDPKDDKLIEDIGAINDQPNRIDPVRPLGTGCQMGIGLGAIGRGG